ncbi:TIGR04282 family arsenosugar biosynthesis glycosyltransferase [Antrihabitans cavernicola]|uniref:DUF2064 domain-containing protein n=1 Tax=Antrihabitans cavernicola TaxID=2495913 RepID=A0A5A7SB98_9NOCA|nr:DUF2064 domain-containing protein [Spelaeibacter cavernicola]KAA0021501.1 DUF2064 domain-containing protein [Spelaeibacter cavernicola]
MRIQVAILVVAKAPVAGQAKTRLQAAMSGADAARLAAAALLDTLDAVARTPVAKRVVALTGDLGHAECGAEIRSALAEFDVIAQRGSDFAHRLANAHADCGALTGLPTLQIGMDTPQVDAELLSAGAQLLCESDAVLGMATDGGWWALGVRDPLSAQALIGVPMSTDTTGAETLAALRSSGARVVALPELADVDVPDDVSRVCAVARADGHFRRVVAEVAPTLIMEVGN